MRAEQARLSCRVYNVGALSCSAADIAAAIRQLLPAFAADYQPDPLRQVRPCRSAFSQL
jgi:hypothetical protein